MKSTPILFSGPMVRAVIERQKRKTRRVVIPQSLGGVKRCPYGQPGDLLWVRESYRFPRAVDDLKPRDVSKFCLTHYSADDDLEGESLPAWAGKLRPSIFLPRWASRLELRITDVAIEPLHAITHEDAIAEGMGYLDDQNRERWSSVAPPGESHFPTPLELFRDTWDALNFRRGYGWETKPFVYVIGFELSMIRRQGR